MPQEKPTHFRKYYSLQPPPRTSNVKCTSDELILESPYKLHFIRVVWHICLITLSCKFLLKLLIRVNEKQWMCTCYCTTLIHRTLMIGYIAVLPSHLRLFASNEQHLSLRHYLSVNYIIYT